MKLSQRLGAITNLVTQGHRVADVGCDHGYVSVYLVKEKISPYVIALDINKEPLEKAKEHSIKYGVSDFITTKLSDGVDALLEGEVDTLICAGMGGRLMLRILEDGDFKIKKMKECILQPQSEIEYFRRGLRQLHYDIVAEAMIYEDGKYYPMMKVIPRNNASAISLGILENKEHINAENKEHIYAENSSKEIEDKFGLFLLKEKNPILLDYLYKEKSKLEKILEDLVKRQEQLDKNYDRVKEVDYELFQIAQAITLFYS